MKEGYLDNRIRGIVVGEMTFASVGPIKFYLNGDFKSDIAGRIFSFHNSQFVDDLQAASRLIELSNPQIGTVSSISFDPHPLLAPHPYIEWFSLRGAIITGLNCRKVRPDCSMPTRPRAMKDEADRSGRPMQANPLSLRRKRGLRTRSGSSRALPTIRGHVH